MLNRPELQEIDLVIAGDPAAVLRFVKRWNPLFHRAIRKVAGHRLIDPAITEEDLLQTLYLHLFISGAAALRKVRALYPWRSLRAVLYRYAVWRTLDEVRRLRTHPKYWIFEGSPAWPLAPNRADRENCEIEEEVAFRQFRYESDPLEQIAEKESAERLFNRLEQAGPLTRQEVLALLQQEGLPARGGDSRVDLVIEEMRRRARDRREPYRVRYERWKKGQYPPPLITSAEPLQHPSQIDGYVARHLIRHLANAGQWDRLHNLLERTDAEGGNWWLAVAQTHGLHREYAEGVHRAWRAAHLPASSPANHVLHRQVYYALVSSSAHGSLRVLPMKIIFALIRHGTRGVDTAVDHLLAEPSSLIQSRMIAELAGLAMTNGLLFREPVRRQIAERVETLARVEAEVNPLRAGTDADALPLRSPRALGLVALAFAGWTERDSALKEACQCVVSLPSEDQACAWADMANEAPPSALEWLAEQYLRIPAKTKSETRGAWYLLRAGHRSSPDELWSRVCQYVEQAIQYYSTDKLLVEQVVTIGIPQLANAAAPLPLRWEILTRLSASQPISTLLPILDGLSPTEIEDALGRLQTLDQRIRKVVRLRLLEGKPGGTASLGPKIRAGAHARECELVLSRTVGDKDWYHNFCTEVAATRQLRDRISAWHRLLAYAPSAWHCEIVARLRTEIRAVRSIVECVTNFIWLLSKTGTDLRTELIEEIKAAVDRITSKGERASLLAQAAASVVPPAAELVRAGLAIIDSMKEHRARAKAWAQFGPMMSDEQFAHAIRDLERTQDEQQRFGHLLRLARSAQTPIALKLRAQLLDESLTSNDPVRGWKLAQMEDLLDAEGCRVVAALRVNLADESWRAKIISRIACYLPGEPLELAIAVLLHGDLAGTDRAQIIQRLAAVPGVDSAALASGASAIRAIGERFSALAALDAVTISSLPVPTGARVDAYRALIKHLPRQALLRDSADLFEAVLDEIDACNPRGRYASVEERAFFEGGVSDDIATSHRYLDVLEILAQRTYECAGALWTRRSLPVGRWLAWTAPQYGRYPDEAVRRFRLATSWPNAVMRLHFQVPLLTSLAWAGQVGVCSSLLREMGGNIWPAALTALQGALPREFIGEILQETGFEPRDVPFAPRADLEGLIGGDGGHTERVYAFYPRTQLALVYSPGKKQTLRGNAEVLAALLPSLVHHHSAAFALRYLGHLTAEQQVWAIIEMMPSLAPEYVIGALRHVVCSASAQYTPLLIITAVDVLARKGWTDAALALARGLPLVTAEAMPTHRISFMEGQLIEMLAIGGQKDALLLDEVKHLPRLAAQLRLLNVIPRADLAKEAFSTLRLLPWRVHLSSLGVVTSAVTSAITAKSLRAADIREVIDAEVRALAADSRTTLLEGLDALVPLLHVTGGPSILKSLMAMVGQVGAWWP